MMSFNRLLSTALPPSVLVAIFWVAAAGCVVAQFFILRAVWKVAPISSEAHTVPAPRRGVEIFWAILPALLMLGAFIGAWRMMHSTV